MTGAPAALPPEFPPYAVAWVTAVSEKAHS